MDITRELLPEINETAGPFARIDFYESDEKEISNFCASLSDEELKRYGGYALRELFACGKYRLFEALYLAIGEFVDLDPKFLTLYASKPDAYESLERVCEEVPQCPEKDYALAMKAYLEATSA